MGDDSGVSEHVESGGFAKLCSNEGEEVNNGGSDRVPECEFEGELHVFWLRPRTAQLTLRLRHTHTKNKDNGTIRTTMEEIGRSTPSPNKEVVGRTLRNAFSAVRSAVWPTRSGCSSAIPGLRSINRSNISFSKYGKSLVQKRGKHKDD